MTRRRTKVTSLSLGTRPAIVAGTACTLAAILMICAALVAPVRVNASGAARSAAAPEATSATLAASRPSGVAAPLVSSPPSNVATAALAPSPEATSATLAPTLSPNRPGAEGALTLAIQYTGGVMGVPEPVHRSVLSLPAGLTLEVPRLRSCSPARLRARGPDGCPPQSLIGRGHALAESLVGSGVISEEVALWAFIGPPQGNDPTLELVGEGSTPVPAQVVVTGTVVPARAPYGEKLVIPVPPIPTLPSATETSLANLTLTIGASGPHRARGANTVVIPAPCPTGGWPFAAVFTYADGSSDSSIAKAPCPTGTKRRPSHAKSARTTSMHEIGNLHLSSKHGFTLNEQGSATGTFDGPIHVRLMILSSSRVKAEVSIARSGGSITGEAVASYHRSSTSASFSGSLSITSGTGSYAHAHGSGLSFGGTIQNSTDAIAVHLSGSLSD
jgi:hypothetical protein